MSTPQRPNEITGANAGGPYPLPTRTRWTARVAQCKRSAAVARIKNSLYQLSLLLVVVLFTSCGGRDSNELKSVIPSGLARPFTEDLVAVKQLRTWVSQQIAENLTEWWISQARPISNRIRFRRGRNPTAPRRPAPALCRLTLSPTLSIPSLLSGNFENHAYPGASMVEQKFFAAEDGPVDVFDGGAFVGVLGFGEGFEEFFLFGIGRVAGE